MLDVAKIAAELNEAGIKTTYDESHPSNPHPWKRIRVQDHRTGIDSGSWEVDDDGTISLPGGRAGFGDYMRQADWDFLRIVTPHLIAAEILKEDP